MDEIIKFLKSFGLGDQEIQKLLKEIPIEQTGLMGTNVATGVFLKGGKKEMSQLPLIVEKITNPFEVNFYKGKPRDEAIKIAEAGIKYLDDEIRKTADLILNKNLQLTQEQKINFAKNLEVKRNFEKDLEDFKTKPEAEVLDIKTKEKIGNIEKLKEEAGLTAPPTTSIGEAQLKIKQVEQGLKDILKNKTNIGDILKDSIESQIRYAQLQRSGLVRAVAREIIEQDLKAGKLKLRPEVEKGMINPTGSGLDGDPIEVYRLYYGEDALEQLDSLAPEFNKSYTAKDAAQIAREKYPNIQPREKPIREYLTPNEIDKMTKKNPPEEFAKGGSVESLGLDYLTGMERNYSGREPNAVGGRVGFAEGTQDAPSITLDSYEKAPDNIDKYPVKLGNLELGIMGAMRSGKSTPDPYSKISTSDRNFTVRGKYNVPDTGISLTGDIGDIRSRSRLNIDVPQYDYKETFKDVMRLNPYSVGIEYAPDKNKNISLRYDDRGNVTLRGEARFAKGGLGYLMGL